MTLHPDVLTDLVILYHAGEASLATRALLEAEAAVNPALQAADVFKHELLPVRRTLEGAQLFYSIALWVLLAWRSVHHFNLYGLRRCHTLARHG